MPNLFPFTARFTNTHSLCSSMELLTKTLEACKRTAFREAKRYKESATITIYDKENQVVGTWDYTPGKRIKRI